MALRIALLAAAFVLGAAFPSAAQDTIYVRTSCAGQPTPCYTSVYTATNWAKNRSTGPPANDAPLLIDIGPGEYQFAICADFGNTTLRGAGTESSGGPYTKIWAAGAFNFSLAGSTCENVTFQRMTIGDPIDLYALAWQAAGNTVWEDVELQGHRWSWYDGCTNNNKGLHYFFDSSATTFALGSEGFRVACSELWWFGGGIRMVSDPNEPPVDDPVTGVFVSGNGDLRVIGSKIQVVADWGPSTGLGTVIGVRVQRSGGEDPSAFGPLDPSFPSGHGTFHMHGTTLSVDATSMSGTEVVGIRALEEGHAHTPGAAFELLPPAAGDGSALRVSVDHTLGGHADSPFTWPASTKPPTGLTETNGFSSHHGYDLWTETDCDPQGRCPGPLSSAESHLMIYDPNLCTGTGNPWLDAKTGRCRNDAGP